MGASICKDMTSSVTHVVAHSVSGSKYKVKKREGRRYIVVGRREGREGEGEGNEV